MASTETSPPVGLVRSPGSSEERLVNIYAVAAVWMGMALAASLISIQLGVSVALVEIVVAAVLGNVPHVGQGIQQTEFTTFLASLGSVLLTFLAGAEIDPNVRPVAIRSVV